MKAISLWQPYASLIAAGVKHYETRSWPTTYRGPLAIHAAKRPPRADELAAVDDAMRAAGLTIVDLPFGAIVCAVRLIRLHRTEDIRDRLTPLELSVGNYADGRFAWELQLVKLPPAPIPAVGRQGLFEWKP